MNYKNIYDSVILKYKNLDLQKLKKDDPNYIYLETHHIIPKCMKGTNDLENLVNLPAREHFICHLLLPKIYKGTEFEYGLWNATYRFIYGNKGQQKIRITSNQYKIIKENVSKFRSEANKGNKNPNYGNKWTQEQKDNLSKKKKGKPSKNKGKHLKEDVKKRISEKLKGKPRPWNRRKRTKEERLLISIKTKEATAKKEHREKFLLGIKNRKQLKGKDNPMYGKKRNDFSEYLQKFSSINNKGTHIYNNGIINIKAKECPKGFVKGSLNKGKKFWINNGVEQKLSLVLLPNFVKGRLKK